MVAFGHTAVGVGVGLVGYHLFQNQNPFVGLLETGALGVASHYVADFIPHGHFFHHTEYKSKIYLIILFDLFGSILLFTMSAFFLYGASLKLLYILFGIGGAQLPDVVDGLLYMEKIPMIAPLKIEHEFHEGVHWHAIHKNGKLITGLPLGKQDIFVAAVIVLSFLALFKY